MKDVAPQIYIHHLEALARAGVTENERSQSQRILLNITAWPMQNVGTMEDDLGATADYSAIASEALEVIGERADKLIETLADEIATRLVQKFSLRKAAVEVQKFVLPDAEYVSVTAVRTAERN